MSIKIEFPDDNKELFSRIDKNYDSFKANDMIEKGCILKLRELPKDLLRYILFKFNQPYSMEETCEILRERVKGYIDENQPDWRKTDNNEYLFFGFLCLPKTKTIYELTMPELKCLCASYSLPRFRHNSKTILVQFIIEQFDQMYPY